MFKCSLYLFQIGLCQTCSPCSGVGPTCVCQSAFGATLCPVKNVLECHIASAKTGRDCMTKEPQCVKNACANGGICSDAGVGYQCFCPGYLPGTFCQTAGKSENPFLSEIPFNFNIFKLNIVSRYDVSISQEVSCHPTCIYMITFWHSIKICYNSTRLYELLISY